MTHSTLCQFLDWDSEFFGLRIGKIVPQCLTKTDLSQALEWARHQQIDCLYFLCDASAMPSLALAQQAGFLLTDVRLTLEIQAKNAALLSRTQSGVRLARAGDIDALKAIARTGHSTTRFFADPHFPRQRCHELYERWIEKSCTGYADAVFVAENQEGKISGYFTCHLDEQKRGSIGLVGVASDAKGQGHGSALLHAALDWFSSNACAVITVVTQGNNIAAQRLYQKHGFLTRSAELWFHYWPAASK